MPSQNFEFAYHRGGGKQADIRYFLGHKSAVINPFDPLVLTTAAAETTASNPVARKLLAADVTAQYTETSLAGILGFAGHEHYSNSSGVASNQAVPSGISAAGQPVFPLPSYGMGIDADPTIGYSRIKVYLASEGNVFWGKLGGGGVTTATNVVLGPAGIDISGSGSTAIFTVDTSETYKPLVIIGWNEVDPTWVLFHVKRTYDQQNTGIHYTTQ